MSDNTQTAKPVKPVNLTNNARALAALARFRALKIIEKAGEVAKKERTEQVEPILYEALKGSDTAIVRGLVAFRLVGSSNSKIDKELLAEKYGEDAVTSTTVTTPYTFIKTL